MVDYVAAIQYDDPIKVLASSTPLVALSLVQAHQLIRNWKWEINSSHYLYEKIDSMTMNVPI